MTAHDHGHDSHDAHHVNYMYVFFALCGFTVLSIGADLLHFQNRAILIVIVLAIASAKALSVMLYFMHLKFERNWKYILLAPTTILAIGIPLALMPDIAFHYYVEDVPQMKAVVHGHPVNESAGGSHGDPKGEPSPRSH